MAPRVATDVKLPAGVERKGRRLIVDERFTIVQVSPSLVLLTRPRGGAAPLRKEQQGTTGFAVCTCSKDGTCKVVTKPSLDGSKITISCGAGTCKGSCTLDAGTWPKSAAFVRLLLAAVAQHATSSRT
jgi:hypothetical protein